MNGTMSMDEILALESGDHGGLIGDFPNQSGVQEAARTGDFTDFQPES